MELHRSTSFAAAAVMAGLLTTSCAALHERGYEPKYVDRATAEDCAVIVEVAKAMAGPAAKGLPITDGASTERWGRVQGSLRLETVRRRQTQRPQIRRAELCHLQTRLSAPGRHGPGYRRHHRSAAKGRSSAHRRLCVVPAETVRRDLDGGAVRAEQLTGGVRGAIKGRALDRDVRAGRLGSDHSLEPNANSEKTRLTRPLGTTRKV